MKRIKHEVGEDKRTTANKIKMKKKMIDNIRQNPVYPSVLI